MSDDHRPSVNDREPAVAKQLIDEIDRFNRKTTGIRDVYEFVVSEGDAGDLAAGVSGCQISNYRGGSCGNAAGLRRDRRGEGGGHDCVVPVAGAATRYLIVYW